MGPERSSDESATFLPTGAFGVLAGDGLEKLIPRGSREPSKLSVDARQDIACRAQLAFREFLARSDASAG
ncbi:hypothetical protein Q1695_013285 [Nippostrongylus brasiliensis]|nr:hypothetical protein Q1695_013285 [Nippostrongylus brasiliensis]